MKSVLILSVIFILLLPILSLSKEPHFGDEIQIINNGKASINYQKSPPSCNQALSPNFVPHGAKFRVEATEYVRCGMMPPVLYLLVIHQRKHGWVSVFNTTDAPTFGGKLPNGYWIYKD